MTLPRESGSPLPSSALFSSSFWGQQSLTAQGLASPLTALTCCQAPKGRGLLAQCTQMKSTFSMNWRRPRQRQDTPMSYSPCFPNEPCLVFSRVQRWSWYRSHNGLHNGPRAKASSLPASQAPPRPAPVVTALAMTFLSMVSLALAQPRPSNRVMPCFCPL